MAVSFLDCKMAANLNFSFLSSFPDNISKIFSVLILIITFILFWYAGSWCLLLELYLLLWITTCMCSGLWQPQQQAQVQYARKYSKRTKMWHAQPKKVEKDYRYWPIIMANILKGRHDDKGSVRRKLERPATHPKNLAPTIGMRQPVPTEDLVKFRNLRYGNRKKSPK